MIVYHVVLELIDLIVLAQQMDWHVKLAFIVYKVVLKVNLHLENVQQETNAPKVLLQKLLDLLALIKIKHNKQIVLSVPLVIIDLQILTVIHQMLDQLAITVLQEPLLQMKIRVQKVLIIQIQKCNRQQIVNLVNQDIIVILLD